VLKTTESDDKYNYAGNAHFYTGSIQWKTLLDNNPVFLSGIFNMQNANFKSGFVNIIGKPNVGKSTLLNALVGEKLSIITPKAQTTRRRILGIVNEPGYQIIFSDTPGIIDNPEYKLHQWMNAQIDGAIHDGDILLLLTDARDELPTDHPLVNAVRNAAVPVAILINKSDLMHKDQVHSITEKWKRAIPHATIISISALNKHNTDLVMAHILQNLPEHPAYYEEDALTDQTERAIGAEIIREKIFLQYQQEIPYNTEVIIDAWKDKGDIIAISALIFVGRDTHKSIIIGKGGAAIKQLGIAARQDMEQFTGKKIFLELFVKVRDNWKNDDRSLRHFGYDS